MNKKKIGIISVVVIGVISLGLVFNNIFTKAQSKDDVSSNIESSQEGTTLSKEDNKDESKEDANKEENKEDSNKKGSKENSEDKSTNKTNEKEDKKDDVNSNKVSSSNDKENSTTSNSKPKPSPSKPNTENTTQEKPKTKTVTIAISCKTAIKNKVNKKPGFTHLPSSGNILSTMKVEIESGDTVFDVLVKATSKKGVHMEYTGSGSSIYVEGIDNLYEFDGGKDSGWMYSVNGVYPNYGCGSYKLNGNEVIRWNYTCDLGKDLGAKR